MKNIKNLKVGDKVYIECENGLGSGGTDTITKIDKQYYYNSGKPYPVIFFGKHKFHGITGKALNSPTMYYMAYKIEL